MPSGRGLPWVVAGALRKNPRVYWAARHAYTRMNRVLPPVVIETVPGPVHRNDMMVDRRSAPSRRNYLNAALEAVGFIDEALQEAGGRLEGADVLDFGCGHGRMVRHLVRTAGTVTACDLDHEGVRFCARHFGAFPVFGDPDIHQVPLWTYDAIWAGSVVTHHGAEISADVLRTLGARVRPGGVLVVTSADEVTLDNYLVTPDYHWLAAHEAELRSEMRESGAAYVTYPQNPAGAYGLGFQTDDWLDDALAGEGLKPLWHRSKAWGAQAVHAWARPEG